MPEMIQRAKLEINLVASRFIVASTLALASVLLKDEPGFRNSLPEPIDVFDHSGNVNISLQAGVMAGLIAGNTYSRRTGRKNGEVSTGRTRKAMALAGLVTGVVINGLAETKVGMKQIDWENVADPIDAAYGITSAVAGAALGCRIHNPNTSEVTQRPLAQV